MKYTKTAALTTTALLVAALSACGGAGKMPEDNYEALTWAVENYTNGNAEDVAEAIPAKEDSSNKYAEAIGHGYVNEKSKCKVDPDSLNEYEGGLVVADVWCEEPLSKASQVDGDPVAYLRTGDDGNKTDLKFNDTYADEFDSGSGPVDPGASDPNGNRPDDPAWDE